MKELQSFFTKCQSEGSQAFTSFKSVNLSSNYTNLTLNYVVKSCSSIVFSCGKDSQFFSINLKCKMEVIFKQQTKNADQYVDSIILHAGDNANKVTLRCKQDSDIQQIYNSLKRIISHKGFTDYFKPLKRLGRGTFATVYLVQHKITKQQSAAKVFSRQGQNLQFKGQQALQNQIKTLRELSHPNIIKYVGVYQTDNLIYLVTEYISGGTLEDTMKTKSSLSGELICKILGDIFEGLKYLDQRSIMHRDIKPENIICRKEDGRWVICDFGLAAKSNEEYLYSKCGTMGYIAPEIMSLTEENPSKYSQSCDIYSLGIIAYTMIIGSLPFKVEMENMFDKKIVWQLFDRPECADIHPQVIQFLKNLLQKDPKNRFSAAQALKSSVFKKKEVVDSLLAYNEKRMKERHERILQIANHNV